MLTRSECDPPVVRESVLTDGNGAVARAAIEAGVSFFSGYPGSPVNTIEPQLRQLDAEFGCGIAYNDALNEHVAVLAAAGASFCGMRSLVVMKHVGMNIAADPLNYLGYSCVKGGMVIVVGTDPGATCSTGEEDVHWYALQCNLPLYEPSTIAAIRDCMLDAYETSESIGVPALLFLPAALCYNADRLPEIEVKTEGSPLGYSFEKDKPLYTNVGAQAVKNHRRLIEKIAKLKKQAGRSELHFNEEAKIGLITRGLCFGHAFEAVRALNLCERVHLLNLETVYPLRPEPILSFARGKDEIFVIEDQDGFLENQIKVDLFNDLDCAIHGKDILPQHGAVTLDMVTASLRGIFGLPGSPLPEPADDVPGHIGTYCEGCPHRASFFAMEQALDSDEVVIGGDIGCSSLPPHKPDWLLCMNAGISLCQGVGQAIGGEKVVSTGGDGSFFHMGLISLISAVNNGIDLLHVLLDNGTIAMTGHQPSPTGTGQKVDMHSLLAAIGVDRVIEVDVFEPDQLMRALEEERERKGVRVIWARGACALQPDAAMLDRRKRRHLELHNDRCGSCKLCYETLQCPAIQRVTDNARDLFIDPDRCMRCGLCLAICPNDAIEKIET